MTNGERFKSAQERAEAFNRFCSNNRICHKCPLADHHDLNVNECRFVWLDLKCEEERPLPCPFCGNIPTVHEICEDAFAVSCVLESCGYWSCIKKTRGEAIAAHNRVAKAVKESEVK